MKRRRPGTTCSSFWWNKTRSRSITGCHLSKKRSSGRQNQLPIYI